MDSKLLYSIWKEDRFTMNIANLFLKPEDSSLFQIKNTYIRKIKKLNRLIIIYLKKDSIDFIFELRKYLPNSNVEDFKCGFYDIDIYSDKDSLRFEIKIGDEKVHQINCPALHIEDLSVDCVTFITKNN